MRIFRTQDGNYDLFPNTTLRFSGTVGANNIHVCEDRSLVLNNQAYRDRSWVYLLGNEISQAKRDVYALQNALGNPIFRQTDVGEFGEVDFDPTGIHPLQHTGRRRSFIHMALESTKIGQAETPEDLLRKMDRLTGNYGISSKGTFR